MERLTGSYVHRGLCYDGDECRQRKRENQVFNSHRNGIGSPTACRMPTDAFRRDAQHEQVEGACARVPDLYNDALSVMDIRFRLFTLLNRFILCLEVLVTDFFYRVFVFWRNYCQVRVQYGKRLCAKSNKTKCTVCSEFGTKLFEFFKEKCKVSKLFPGSLAL